MAILLTAGIVLFLEIESANYSVVVRELEWWLRRMRTADSHVGHRVATAKIHSGNGAVVTAMTSCDRHNDLRGWATCSHRCCANEAKRCGASARLG
jgi:hypothetical protein